MNAHNLRELRLQLSWNWVPTRHSPSEGHVPFPIENVRNVMLRKQSQLRVVGIGRVLYKVRLSDHIWIDPPSYRHFHNRETEIGRAHV